MDNKQLEIEDTQTAINSKAKKDNKIEGILSPEELVEWSQLTDYLCLELFPYEKSYAQVFTTIKRYKEKYGYTYTGIREALKYFYDELKNPVPLKAGVGIVPYYYNQAHKYYTMENEVEILIKNINKLFKLPIDRKDPKIYQSIYKFHKDYNCTYKGILSTLDYFYKILQNPIPELPHINIVPYYYNEALDFYKRKKNIKDNNKIEKIPIIKVYINEDERNKYQQEYDNLWLKNKKITSIEEIEVSENEIFERL